MDVTACEQLKFGWQVDIHRVSYIRKLSQTFYSDFSKKLVILLTRPDSRIGMKGSRQDARQSMFVMMP